MVQEFRLPYQRAMRVLDALNWIAENVASDLAYRWFCGSKMCGTCAVRMNGREVLACWEAVEPEMTIEPLRNLPVIRDLVVDRAPFDRKVESLEPWIERTEPYAGFPEPLVAQGHEERLEGARLHRLHGCYSACPVIGLGDLTELCRSGAAGATRPDRARSAQRSRQGRPRAGADRHLQLRVLLQVRGGLPGQHPDRDPRDRAAQGAARPRSFPAWPAPACRCARSWRRAAASIPARSCSACRDLPPCATYRASCGCSSAARSIPARTLLGFKTAAASAARRLLGKGGTHEVRLLPRLLGAQHLRRAQ